MPFTSTGVGMEQRDWREQCEAVSGEGQMWDGGRLCSTGQQARHGLQGLCSMTPAGSPPTQDTLRFYGAGKK